jgi:hypothetical protein
LKFALSNMSLATPACFQLLLAWCIFFHPFTFILCISLWGVCVFPVYNKSSEPAF